MDVVPDLGLDTVQSEDYQLADFESVWKLSPGLSDEEVDLFADVKDIGGFELQDKMSSPFENSPLLREDPVMSSMALDDIISDYLPAVPADSTVVVEEMPSMTPNFIPRSLDESAERSYIETIHSYTKKPETQSFQPETAIAGDEIHYELSDDESDIEVESKVSTTTSQVSEEPIRRSRRQVKRKRFDSEESFEDDEENKPSNIKKAKKSDKFSNGKTKLYSAGPFNNPELERQRLNALNAKKNREKKKQEQQHLKTEVTRLQSENKGLKRTAIKMQERATNAELELQRLHALLRANNLESLMKSAGNSEVTIDW